MQTRFQNRWQRQAVALAARLPRARWHPAVLARIAAPRGRGRAPWAVALSGGADSLSLLLLLWAYRGRDRQALLALHFNHRLRGRASAADERFCRAVCRALHVRLRVGRWAGARTGASEEEARTARFAFFDGAMRRSGARVLWLGHQQNDIAESILMRLARGSGTAGLAAPRPVQTVGRRVHLRPLLPWKKEEIVAALRTVGAVWREDRSNESGGYFRNRIRRRVLPAWQRAAGRDALAGAALARERLEEDDAALEAWLNELDPGGAGDSLNLSRLRGRPMALWRRALRRWLTGLPGAADLSRQGFEDLLAAVAAGRPTRRSLGRTGFAVIRGNRLVYERRRAGS